VSSLGVLQKFRLILVAPLYAGNIGSVARLAMNFELFDVILVAPQCDYLDTEAQKFACRLSQDMLRSFRVVSTLQEAIADCPTVVGFTRRMGEFRKCDVEVDGISDLPSLGRVALVFGREDNGISRDEILCCTHVCSLPSSDACPSLNLSHAVAVVLSRLFALQPQKAESGENAVAVNESELPATADAIDELMAEWRTTLVAVGLNRAGNPERMLPHLLRILQRSRVTDRDVRILRGFLGHTQIALGLKPPRR
jgi:tRNA/rRNA methyltransferase